MHALYVYVACHNDCGHPSPLVGWIVLGVLVALLLLALWGLMK